jgi:GT2 family glycosyltransferase
MASSPDLAVVIVSWNVRKQLDNCLRSIFALPLSERPSRVIVIDNASSDGTVQLVQSSFPQVRLIFNDRNRGFAAACNQGIQEAGKTDVLLLNPDTQISPGLLLELQKAVQRHPQGVIFGPLLINPDGSRQPSVRRLPTLSSLIANFLKFQHWCPKSKTLKHYFAEDLDPTREQKVEQIMGAAFFIRSNAFEQIGLFDEDFFIWFEEVDYCARVKSANLEVWYIPSVKIMHYGAESFKRAPSIKKQKWWLQSALRYARKHFSFSKYILLTIVGCISFSFSVIISILSKIFQKKQQP